MGKTLTLPLKACYFDQIKAGTKPFEYRLRTPYWEKRLAKAPFRQIVLTKGYPKADDTERRMVLPWRGYVNATLQHEHFGPAPVEVFAIVVGAMPVEQGAETL